MSKLRKKGFTLVELIVVMAIIAILAAVAVPTTIHFVDKANISKEEQQMNVSNTIQSLFAASSGEPFDLSETAINTEDRFINRLVDSSLPYQYLGKIEITITGGSDKWTVSYTLKGQEYGNKNNGSKITGTVSNTYTNAEIFKGSTLVPTKTATYVYSINKLNGAVNFVV